MKINFINSYNYSAPVTKRNINFKDCNEWFTDSEPTYWGDVGRHFIRNGIYQSMFGVGIHQETAEETKKATKLEDGFILNFHELGNSSYSGESLVHNYDLFNLLNNSGVKKIIDLVNKPALKETCAKYNLEYYSYDMDLKDGKHSIFQDMNSILAQEKDRLYEKGLPQKDFDMAVKDYINTVNDQNTQYVRELKELIDLVNRGKFYMSCEYGYRTMNCLSLVTLFNPDWYGEKYTPTKQFINKIVNMYKNLTNEHKQILGMNEKYYVNLKKKISEFAGNI